MRRVIGAFRAATGIAAFIVLAPLPVAAQPAQSATQGQQSPAVNPAGAPATTEADKAAALKLAKEAEKLMSKGQFADAFELFRQADERVHAPTFVLKQAVARSKMGALLEARALYSRVIEEKLDAKSPWQFRKAQEEAKKQLTALEQRIPVLQVTIKTPSPDARIALDDVDLPLSSSEQLIEINPGPHTITASTKESATISFFVTMREGTTERIEIAFPPGKPPAPCPAPPKQDPAVRPPLKPVSTVYPQTPDEYTRRFSLAGPANIAFGIGAISGLTGFVTGTAYIVTEDRPIGNVATASLVYSGVNLAIGIALLVVEEVQQADERKILLRE